MVSKLRVNSLFKLSALLLLSAGEMHGYELIREMQRFGQRTSPGQVYPFLSMLEKQKLVKARQTGKREKKVYSLTVKGRAFVGEMLGNFDNLIQIAIKPKLNTCAHCGCKVLGEGHGEKICGKLLHFCCASCAKNYNP